MAKKCFMLMCWLLVAICPVFLYAQSKEKVIVLGFDGLDPVLVQKWIAVGKLPQLGKLAKEGTFCKLQTTNPAQSPVAWATFATGNNPGKHRIYGFLRREQGEYRPRLGLARAESKPVIGGSLARVLWALLVAAIVFTTGYMSLFRVRKFRLRAGISGTLAVGFGAFFAYQLLFYIPYHVPSPVPLKTGESFWTLTGRAGVKTKVLMAPIAFPAEEVPNGHLLCGFGVPDIAATNGTWYVYNSRFSEAISTETGGWLMPLRRKGQIFSGHLLGPTDILAQEEAQRLEPQLENAGIEKTRKIRNRLTQIRNNPQLRCPFTATKQNGDFVAIAVGDRQEQVALHRWSDWFRVPFKMGPWITVYGMVRFKVVKIDENDIELYATPVQFHPEHPLSHAPLSSPPDYSAQLAKNAGLYTTLGWAAATNPLKDEMIDEDTFWQDLQNNIQARRRIFSHVFTKEQWDLLVCVFYFPDRAGHMYWRFIDPDNPRHKEDSEKFPEHRQALLQIYQQVDEIVGEVATNIASDTTLLIVSDHGFAPFRWQVNLNTWLRDQGYLVEKQRATDYQRRQVRQLFQGEDFLQQIDWTKTKAYAIGLGKVFLNVEGRDPQGIIAAVDYRREREELRQKLLELRHQQRKVIEEVYRKEEIYHGEFTAEAADLEIGFATGYRISWQTSLGGIPPNVFDENRLKWSGDHCSVAPHLVPGTLVSNRKIDNTNPHIQDVTATILQIYDISAAAVDGKPLSFSE